MALKGNSGQEREGWGKGAISDPSQMPATTGGRALALRRDFIYLFGALQEPLFSVHFFTKSNCSKPVKNNVSNLCDPPFGRSPAGQ